MKWNNVTPLARAHMVIVLRLGMMPLTWLFLSLILIKESMNMPLLWPGDIKPDSTNRLIPRQAFGPTLCYLITCIYFSLCWSNMFNTCLFLFMQVPLKFLIGNLCFLLKPVKLTRWPTAIVVVCYLVRPIILG